MLANNDEICIRATYNYILAFSKDGQNLHPTINFASTVCLLSLHVL